MFEKFSLQSFCSGAALGVILASVWFVVNPNDLLTARQTVSDAKADATSFVKSGAIEVSDQEAGNSVAIDSITVSPPGVWVAVREFTGSDLGNVLGAYRVGGPRSHFSVPLLRATLPGRSYAVELYRDDGSGIFDLSAMSVYVDFDTGARVVAPFKTLP